MKLNFSPFALLFTVLVANLLLSCDDQRLEDQIPFVSFPDIIINLKSQQYLGLQNEGFVFISGGVRGIIIHKSTFGNQYVAFERNCSYQPNDACALVEVSASTLTMEDKCCGSTFEFSEGLPLGGPARNPLRRYRTSVSGDFLTITDEPVN